MKQQADFAGSGISAAHKNEPEYQNSIVVVFGHGNQRPKGQVDKKPRAASCSPRGLKGIAWSWSPATPVPVCRPRDQAVERKLPTRCLIYCLDAASICSIAAAAATRTAGLESVNAFFNALIAG